jgi:hypothetical protein
VGKKCGCSEGYPQRNAAQMGSISLWIFFASIFFACQILMTLEFSRQILKYPKIMNLIKICPVYAEVFHADRPTDG